MSPNVCVLSVWKLRHVTVVAPRILKWRLDLWNICAPLVWVLKYKFRCSSRHETVCVTDRAATVIGCIDCATTVIGCCDRLLRSTLAIGCIDCAATVIGCIGRAIPVVRCCSKSVCSNTKRTCFQYELKSARGILSHVELSQSKHVPGLQRSCWASLSRGCFKGQGLQFVPLWQTAALRVSLLTLSSVFLLSNELKLSLYESRRHVWQWRDGSVCS